MKKYLKKKSGFTLIEVVISIAIIAIVSVGVYNGYLLLISQIKAAEVRQTASLEGKKLLEEIKSTIENDKFKETPEAINVGNMVFENIGGVYTRYLDENFHEINREAARYTETITLEETEAIGSTTAGQVSYITIDKIEDNQNEDSQDINYMVYVIREEKNSVIREYIKCESVEADLKSDSDKIILYVYFYRNPANEIILKIKSFDGTELISKAGIIENTNDFKINLYMNFNEYKASKALTLKDVEVNVYNNSGYITDIKDSTESTNTSDNTDMANTTNNMDTVNDFNISDSNVIQSNLYISNIYIEKAASLNVSVNPCKGEINVYDNRAEDVNRARIGTLHDITVVIRNSNQDILFTGNSKQNIKDN